MKRSVVLTVLLASGLVLSAAAQTPAAPAGPARIAVISFQIAVSQTNEFQRNFADLQKRFDPRVQQLKALNDDIDALGKQLQDPGNKLNVAERASKAKTLEEKQKQLERSKEDAQNDYNSEMGELINNMDSKVYDVLANYVQQQGYTLVLDSGAGQQQAQTVLYASPATDITKIIIDAYNAKSGVPAPPAQPPAAPKPAASQPAKAPAAH
jgi:outer membrane protein